ncbi:hypothetical protein KVU_1245 [Ketogulonicigenium vulgare WSH-001]|uniref:Uncharacterized protein n=1 Tax=Ketogulonicigenium vulgare (strain WSH-001) TaxID=759362 RepID=F9Y7F6_KETVW|nr:hypothetical protein KVU_1245 [Ketogulonicigenium vulgare WSH-001]
MADDPVEWLQLYRSRRVGAATFWRLLRTHGSAGAALAALPEMAAAAGLPITRSVPLGSRGRNCGPAHGRARG